MHLAPHHFQAQARFIEDTQQFALTSLFPYAHGLVGLEMDEEALRNGTVSLLHARGIMPDGLPFHFPHDPLPEPLQVETLFSPTAQSHRILLAVPPFRPTGANCAENHDGRRSDTRFVSSHEPVLDAITGQDEKAVSVARKNFRLLVDAAGEGANGDTAEPGAGGEAHGEGLVTLPIARVRRDGSGNFAYDPEFVPTSLQVGASRSLVEMLARIVDVLESRSVSLKEERGGGASADRGHGPGELLRYWLAHAVNSNLPVLRHHLETRRAHPERLFADLSRLAGALSTFSLSGDASALPLYDHGQPGPGFGTLEREIRRHLETVVPTNVVDLPVHRRDGYFHTATVEDRRVLGDRAHWYLGVGSSGRREDVIGGVPRLVKVCSAKHIDRLVQEAYPGLDLEHAPSLPSGFSPRPGTEYFRIGRTEPCWQSITDTGQVGIYVPGSIPDPDLELVAVMETRST